MADYRKAHPALVDDWLKANAAGLKSPELVSLLEQAIQALWNRARGTLSEVTLEAILDRVVYSSAAKYPLLASVKITENGISLTELKKEAATQNRDELILCLRFLLIEFLAITGSLTGQVITPALHSELRNTKLKKKRATK